MSRLFVLLSVHGDESVESSEKTIDNNDLVISVIILLQLLCCGTLSWDLIRTRRLCTLVCNIWQHNCRCQAAAVCVAVAGKEGLAGLALLWRSLLVAEKFYNTSPWFYSGNSSAAVTGALLLC